MFELWKGNEFPWVGSVFKRASLSSFLLWHLQTVLDVSKIKLALRFSKFDHIHLFATLVCCYDVDCEEEEEDKVILSMIAAAIFVILSMITVVPLGTGFFFFKRNLTILVYSLI